MNRHARERIIAVAACVLFVMASWAVPPAGSADPEAGKPPAAPAAGDGEEAKSASGALSERDKTIKELLLRVEALEREVRSLRKEAPQKTAAEGPPAQATTPATQPPPQVALQDEKEKERLIQSALERALISRTSLLLPRGTIEIEPSLTYIHASSDAISIDGFTIDPVLVIGEIVSRRVRRELILPALTFRFGLPDDFQIETRFPVRYEYERTVSADSTERSRKGYGAGDVEIALSKHLHRESGWTPDVIGTLRWKTDTGHNTGGEIPTGTGFHALQAMLTSVKIKDPAAFFGSVSHTFNIPEKRLEGRINPGDMWGFDLGMAVSLNPETSISFALDHRFTNRTTIDRINVPGSAQTVGNLHIGAAYAFSPAVSLDASLAVGLTRDAPDMQITVAVPVRLGATHR